MQFNTLFLLTAAVFFGQAAATTVQLCGQPGGSECTEVRNAPDGQCSDVGDLFNDRVKSAKISGGNCVFWANKGCNGDHTNQIFGNINDLNTACSGGWQNRVSSYKCCGANEWCAGNTPKCT